MLTLGATFSFTSITQSATNGLERPRLLPINVFELRRNIYWIPSLAVDAAHRIWYIGRPAFCHSPHDTIIGWRGPGDNTEISVSNSDPRTCPAALTLNKNKDVWFTDEGTQKIGKVSLHGRITEYPVQSPHGGTPEAITSNKDGNVWFVQSSIGASEVPSWTNTYGIRDGIGRVEHGGNVKIYILPKSNTCCNRGTTGISIGPDNNIWFTEMGANVIGRMTPRGKLRQYPIPTKDSEPLGIVSDKHAYLWFTENKANKIGRIGVDGQISEYNVPTPNSRPASIAVSRDGSVWFTEAQSGKLARLTNSGKINEWQIPRFPRNTEGLSALALSTDGSIYVAVGNKIRQYTITPR
jgi:virginiamycin B lyase